MGFCRNRKLSLINSKGFTLIELIIVMAIMSIVLTLGFSMLLNGQKTFNMSIDKTDVQSDIRMAADFITKELRNVQAISVSNTQPASTPSENYIYADSADQKMKYWAASAANPVDKTDAFIQLTTDLTFALKKVNDKYMISFTINGSKGTTSYSIQSEVLLNNITSATTGTGRVVSFVYPVFASPVVSPTPTASPATSPTVSPTATPSPVPTSTPLVTPTPVTYTVHFSISDPGATVTFDGVEYSLGNGVKTLDITNVAPGTYDYSVVKNSKTASGTVNIISDKTINVTL